MVRSEIEEIEELQRKLYEKKQALQRKQANCVHSWSETKYDPEEILVQYSTGGYTGSGVDKWPQSAYRRDKKPRWSRTCRFCGKVEYSYKQKAVKYEADFS